MHHAPSGPSFTERLVSALYRALRPAHGRRVLVRPRLAGVLLGSVVLGLLVAALPMVSTAPDAPTSAALNGSSSDRTGSSQGRQAHRDVVEMGVDGAPASSPSSSSPAAASTVPARAAAPGVATLPAATTPRSASSSVAAPAGSGSASAAGTPAARPVLSQPPVTLPVPPVTLPPVTVPPVTSPSPSPTTTDPSPSPTTTDPSSTP